MLRVDRENLYREALFFGTTRVRTGSVANLKDTQRLERLMLMKSFIQERGMYMVNYSIEYTSVY